MFRGQGALSHLEEILPHYKNILIVIDRDAFHPCGAAEYFKLLEEKLAGRCTFHYVSYAGKALPIEDVEGKYLEVKQYGELDLITAIGGGTVIDLAKILAIAYSNACESAADVLASPSLDNRVDLLFIPTTAGTGSEATTFAVVYKDKVKYSIDRPGLLPAYTILDPLLLRSLPAPVLHATVLDALAQAIEAIWARASTAEAKQYAQNAVRLILDNIESQNPIERLSQLQEASHLAGKAINITRTTLPHSISYPLTSHFGVPHGIAVFLTLPGAAELNYYTTGENVQAGVSPADVEKSFALLFSLFEVEDIKALRERLSSVIVRLGFSMRLRNYGIGEADLSLIVDYAFTKGRIDNNPRQASRDDVLNILKEII
ncbi:MAG: Iron-containing alcohol dehydrogenase [Acidobacteriota bacterium]|nr:Iron-containing alcohol dehydrogenase [Acidobacteriota bacterium]